MKNCNRLRLASFVIISDGAVCLRGCVIDSKFYVNFLVCVKHFWVLGDIISEMHFKGKWGDALEKEEFEREAGKYMDNIFAVAFNYFKDPADADDIVQEVLMKLLKSDKVFESSEHVRNWLLRVTVNQCRKVSVSSWFRKSMPLEDYAESLKYEDPEESELFFAVIGLPKKYRIVVHLYYYEDYSTAEIAELLKIKESTVRTRLRRARIRLKEVLTDEWEDE